MTTISGNNVSYTASNLVDSIGGLIQRTPTSNSSDTLPTAANIITSFTGSNIAGNVGQSFVFTIYNNSAFVITINTNTGVSLIDGTTTDSIYPQCTRMYTVIQTAVSQVMIYMIGNSSVNPETNTDIYLASGKILVGSTDNVAASTTLSAGSGISISNGGGGGIVTIASTGGSGTVTSVSGTTNRITITGTPTVAPVVDIASAYIGQTSITTLGTITSGTWNGAVIGSTYGGTGVNNGSNTITLGGNLTTSGAFTTTLTATANTSITLPTSGTLLNDALTSANFYVGNGSNVATGVPMTGDATLANTGDVTVTQVNGTAISIGTAFLLNLTINRPITTINTTATATAAQWVFGIIESTPTGNFNLTTPTAAQIVAYIPSASVGMTFTTIINNVATLARTVTIVNGTGVTRFGNIVMQIVDANPITGRYFMTIYSRITNVTPGTEAIVMHPG